MRYHGMLLTTTCRTIVAFTCLLSSIFLWASCGKRPPYPSYDYDIAQAHEIKPHRYNIPLKGVPPGHNQLSLTLIVSPTGDVVHAYAGGNSELLKFWPLVQAEVRRWKFTPFEENGKAVTAEVKEYIDFVPPERFPKLHVAAPPLQPNSKVTITLVRRGCFGSCPSYTITIGTDGIVFEGQGYVVASGRHTDRLDEDKVRNLANRFVAADFYSMDPVYQADVTDNPAYVLSIAIDGRTKQVVDYVGAWVGMPAVITELEDDVDTLGRTDRWVSGSEGLVQALQAEKFSFRTFEAQLMLKEAAIRGMTATVKEFLEGGVPLEPLPAPKSDKPYYGVSFDTLGWLNAASRHPDTLQVLINTGASKNDQADKDLALGTATRLGIKDAARALIAYGANPNAGRSR